jgi:hypothetical protein
MNDTERLFVFVFLHIRFLRYCESVIEIVNVCFQTFICDYVCFIKLLKVMYGTLTDSLFVYDNLNLSFVLYINEYTLLF